MRWLQSFWGPEVAYFGPLEDPLSMDQEIPFIKHKLSIVLREERGDRVRRGDELWKGSARI